MGLIEKPLMTYIQKYGNTLTGHEVYVSIKAGAPMGKVMGQITMQGSAMTALYVQAHGQPNLVPCEQCEANLPDMFPFWGCWSIADPNFNGHKCGCCWMLKKPCTFDDEKFANLRAQVNSYLSIGFEDINAFSCTVLKGQSGGFSHVDLEFKGERMMIACQGQVDAMKKRKAEGK